ncbi:hypothetical protein KAR04_03680 [Candidatus Calescamantes bacterium]|nr:hypothetical protein [Candidatus Calescamantes bacterium]MCK5599212.1 hypothetical protein [bacterium]
MEYTKWSIKEEDLKDLTLIDARNLIIICFYEAQKESIASTKKDMNSKINDGEMYNSVLARVRFASKQCGGDWENPSLEYLLNIVKYLENSASAAGTPDDIVAHHKNQILKVLEACDKQCG